jgi:hypothetical protein
MFCANDSCFEYCFDSPVQLCRRCASFCVYNHCEVITMSYLGEGFVWINFMYKANATTQIEKLTNVPNTKFWPDLEMPSHPSKILWDQIIVRAACLSKIFDRINKNNLPKHVVF